jgi:glycine betaine/proline transport system permease protein
LESNQYGDDALKASISQFVDKNSAYYQKSFRRIQEKKGFAFTWNTSAAIFGPLWAGFRSLWGFFGIFLILEIFAIVQIGNGLWGELGHEHKVKYERLLNNVSKREAQAKEMIQRGDKKAAENMLKIVENLKKNARRSQAKILLAEEGASQVLLVGILLLLAVKGLEGFSANSTYEGRYLQWRSNPEVSSGISYISGSIACVLLIAIWPLILFAYTVPDFDQRLSLLTGGILGKKIPLSEFPIGREYFSYFATQGDKVFDYLILHFGNVFNGITVGIHYFLECLETVLIDTPWPVMMTVIVVGSLRMAGPRVAIFSLAALLYLGFMGLWEISMITVALIGTGAFLCILFGIPIGIYFGKSDLAYRIGEPILDFMQTMPAFVYLIPIIAFFGTGKPPGILATVIFAMPPVIRLTALGIRQVPEKTKEAALSFGCTKWQLMRHVEVPLAMPSIMTGINQTILMSLSMVVMASLIGAEGLGTLILESLQYAAKGQGILAGIAILLCAMVIDRITQGLYKKNST